MKQPICGSGSSHYKPERKPKVLSSMEWAIIRAVAERNYPVGAGISLGADDCDVVGFIDDYLAEMPKTYGMFLRIFFILFEFAPLLLIRKPGRFSSLSVPDQERYLEAWDEHPIYYFRMGMLLVKSLCAMGYFTDQRVRDEMGYYVVCEGGRQAYPASGPS